MTSISLIYSAFLLILTSCRISYFKSSRLLFEGINVTFWGSPLSYSSPARLSALCSTRFFTFFRSTSLANVKIRSSSSGKMTSSTVGSTSIRILPAIFTPSVKGRSINAEPAKAFLSHDIYLLVLIFVLLQSLNAYAPI